jgi:hypothetical protein
MAHAFFLGIDLADASDAPDATVTVLEKERAQNESREQFRLHHARHHAAVAPEALADDLQGFVAEQPYIGRTNIVVNQTSTPGRALVEALRDRGLDPVAVTVTGGPDAAPPDAAGESVSLGLVDAVQILADLHRNEQLVLEEHATEAASALARGTQRAARVLDEAEGDRQTPAADGEDLTALTDVPPAVTSAALAAWCATERSFDPSQHLKEDPQTSRPRDDERA